MSSSLSSSNPLLLSLLLILSLLSSLLSISHCLRAKGFLGFAENIGSKSESLGCESSESV